MHSFPFSAARRTVAVASCAVFGAFFFGQFGRAAEPDAPKLEVTTARPALVKQLQAALDEKDTAAQIEICRRLLADAPQDGDLLAQLARAQIDAADFNRAAATLDALAKAAGDAASAAKANELRGDLAAAKNLPDEAGRFWGAALRAAWPEGQAVDLLKIAASPVENRAVVLEKIAALQEKTNHWEAAAKAWRDRAAMDDKNAGYRARLAVCLLNSGQCAEAAREMKAANALDATDATVKAELPRFEWLTQQLPVWRKLDAPPAQKDPETPFVRARFLAAARADPAALAEAQRALTANPRSLAAQVLTGLLLYKTNMPDAAARLSVAQIADAAWLDNPARLDRLRAADGAIAADPAKGTNYSRRAAELLALDQPALALPEAQQAVKLAPRSADAAVLLAAALLRMDQPGPAREQAERAAALDPRSADAWAMLGRLEQERANFPAAIDDLSRALKLREQIRWLQRREDCLRAVGRDAEADRDRQRLAKLQPPGAPDAAPKDDA